MFGPENIYVNLPGRNFTILFLSFTQECHLWRVEVLINSTDKTRKWMWKMKNGIKTSCHALLCLDSGSSHCNTSDIWFYIPFGTTSTGQRNTSHSLVDDTHWHWMILSNWHSTYHQHYNLVKLTIAQVTSERTVWRPPRDWSRGRCIVYSGYAEQLSRPPAGWQTFSRHGYY